MSTPPSLDREAVRLNLAVITGWRADIERNYNALLTGSDAARPDDAEAIRAFEHACLDDQEWAAGYESGRVDAERVRDGGEPSGPGISWFGDGYSASVTRQAAYELGVADGSA